MPRNWLIQTSESYAEIDISKPLEKGEQVAKWLEPIVEFAKSRGYRLVAFLKEKPPTASLPVYRD